MNDMYDPTVPPVDDRTPATEPAPAADVPVDHVPDVTPEVDGHDDVNGVWRAEAGRKGAKRVHQLIQAGKLYEQEHGLKSGRQRLRQLIELGKLYEAEHGQRPDGKKRRGSRLSRQERDEVVSTLLKCLVRIAKPSFRQELGKLAEALSPEKSQAASLLPWAFYRLTLSPRRPLRMSATATESSLLDRLRAIVGPVSLLTERPDLVVYECDGFTIEKTVPDVVVFPTTTDQIVRVVKLCNELGVPFLARGAGTSLAGGCVPVGGGVMIALSRMKRILEVDYANRYAVVEPGVVNKWLTDRCKDHGFHFAPDPSSQGACTIGGNVATNSGGPHTLKYGVTVNHVLGVELVLPDGRVIVTGGPAEDSPGYDLTGVIVGCEGTFGIVSKTWVRITRNPEAYRTLLGVFDSVDDATNTISDIIGAGIVPGALELLDRLILGAVEQAFKFGFPLDAGAVLIMEVDGLAAGLDEEAAEIEAIAKRNNAREVRRANSEAERLLLWKSRKQAFGAIGRLAPSYCTQDGVVPRSKLPEMLRFITATGEKHGIRIANVFHAGDGNIHPILLFDERDPELVKRVLDAGHDILNECIRLGGSVTGEHGIGVEKIDLMPKLFSPTDLAMMVRLREAFNPTNLCSPHKMLPTAGACAEPSRVKPGRRAAV